MAASSVLIMADVLLQAASATPGLFCVHGGRLDVGDNIAAA